MKKIDKRTKDYKESVKNTTSRGLGDTVKKITDATGISKLVKKVFGEDCGCDERQEYLNKLFPYNNQPLDCDAYDKLSVLQPWNRQGLTKDEAGVCMSIYRKFVDAKQQDTTCSPCFINIVKKLKERYDSYEKVLKDNEL